MTMVGHDTTAEPAYRWGALLMVVATAAIITALGFDYVGGYTPCPLCLQERYAYYAGIPLSFAALVAASMGRWRVAGLLFFVVALGFLTNAGLGTYHAGVEWKWWPGPDTCSGALMPLAKGGLLESLSQTRVVRCDEAPWSFAGLSFAGWNAVVSATLAVVAMKAGVTALARE